jgi:predicted DNA-binding transcriptional regulator AlpA
MTRYVSAAQLAKRYDVNKSTIWRWVQRGDTLPKPIKLSEQCTRFDLDEVERRDAERAQAA